jgi:O-antigen/teichoic acid export membrane protein
MSITGTFALLRLQPFDCRTPEGRAKERYRRMALTASSSLASRGVSVLTGLVSVPLTLRYLGHERFGLWGAISSLAVMLQFTDLGMGNGLINAIARAHGDDDQNAARRAVSSTFFFLLGIAAAVTALFCLAYPFVPWPKLYNVNSAEGIAEAGPATLALFCCWALGMPLSVAQRVQIGFQEGYRRNFWLIVGSMLSLVCVVTAAVMRASLPMLVLAMTATTALTQGLNCVAEFIYSRPSLRPSLRCVDWGVGWGLVKSGILFSTLTLASIAGTSTDYLVISNKLGAAAVTDYSIVAKLSIATMLTAFIFQPLWPAFGEAIQRGDLDWVRKAVRKSFLLAAAISLGTGLLLTLLGPSVVLLWLRGRAMPPMPLFFAFAFLGVVFALNDVLVSILSTSHFLKAQVVLAVLGGSAALVAKITLVPFLQSAGAPWGTALGYAMFFTLPGMVFVYKKVLAEKGLVKQTAESA